MVLKLIKHKYPNTEVYVFARSMGERAFAEELGAAWTGDMFDQAPHKLDSIIDTTPAWKPIVAALANLESGGRLVINAICKEGDKRCLLGLDYLLHFWQEKEIKSVANITRANVKDFLTLASEINLQPEVQVFALEQANEALVVN